MRSGHTNPLAQIAPPVAKDDDYSGEVFYYYDEAKPEIPTDLEDYSYYYDDDDLERIDDYEGKCNKITTYIFTI